MEAPIAASLSDGLDATFRELDRLMEQWEQAQSYERALARIRALEPAFAAVLADVAHLRASLTIEGWSSVREAILRERPAEMEAVARALTAEEDRFLRLVDYAGFARGALAAARELQPIARHSADTVE